MKSKFLKFAFLFLLLPEFSTSHLLALSGFVSCQGTNFMLNGKPYFFAGANCYDFFTYGDGSSTSSSNAIESSYMSKSAIDAQMARMQADGVTVLRTWGFNHQGTWHVFEASKGVYNEPEFREFDYILNSASNHNIRVIVALENYWTAYGGIDTRLSWEGLTGGDPGRRIFFTNPPAILGYTNYVKYFLNRTNHYTGIQYKNDQTVFAWEVMNEPRYQGESSSQNLSGTKLRAWVDSVGAFIKNVDTNHLLGTGMEGQGTAYGYGGDNGSPFVYIHQSPYIDFCSAHMYPTESWANLSIAQTTNLIRAWAHDAHVTVGKPFFLGEFNVMNGSSLGTRSNYWYAIYKTIEGQNIGGSAFWWYEESSVDGTYGVLQGATELGVFRAHAAVMQAKSAGSSIATTLGLTTSGSPSTYGSPVTFTATVRTNNAAVGNISGESITFYDGVVSLGTGTLNGSGQAAYLTGASQLSAATHSITAVYRGDATYAGSTNSPALSQTVNQETLTVSGVTAANKVYDGTTVATLLGTPGLIGMVSNDDVSLWNGAVTASFADPAVGFGKPVAVGGYSLLGTAVTNYTLVQPTGLTADILSSTTPVFVGQGISKDPGGWKLNFSGQAGQTYTVLATSDLTEPINQWTALTTGTFGSGAVVFIDGSNTPAARFYLISP